jgi:hypothetical protein
MIAYVYCAWWLISIVDCYIIINYGYEPPRTIYIRIHSELSPAHRRAVKDGDIMKKITLYCMPGLFRVRSAVLYIYMFMYIRVYMRRRLCMMYVLGFVCVS